MSGSNSTTIRSASTTLTTLTLFKGSWTRWLQSIPAQKFFVSLPASKAAASSGYIPKEVLISQVLPFVKSSPKFGGIMLWDRFHDWKCGYSDIGVIGKEGMLYYYEFICN
ncbi:hypothetical protein RHMOL_Rhmol03G0063600 [Rhododendron molle]|uniref:Uncharacterized protein n=1 Tax=Rhododendron molle TaxID=49168 RepID=A0ACC0PCA6_RHOML|nr:hypothetical protein RHMOL_Rhmol03G0063600 [Rhododendron molle]